MEPIQSSNTSLPGVPSHPQGEIKLSKAEILFRSAIQKIDNTSELISILEKNKFTLKSFTKAGNETRELILQAIQRSGATRPSDLHRTFLTFSLLELKDNLDEDFVKILKYEKIFLQSIDFRRDIQKINDPNELFEFLKKHSSKLKSFTEEDSPTRELILQAMQRSGATLESDLHRMCLYSSVLLLKDNLDEDFVKVLKFENNILQTGNFRREIQKINDPLELIEHLKIHSSNLKSFTEKDSPTREFILQAILRIDNALESDDHRLAFYFELSDLKQNLDEGFYNDLKTLKNAPVVENK